MKEPKGLLTRILEIAAIFALIAFLLNLGVCYLQEVWWVLLIIAVVIGVGVALYRIWKKKNTW